MRGPGFEPGSSAWKADILTTILPTQNIDVINSEVLKFLFLLCFSDLKTLTNLLFLLLYAMFFYIKRLCGKVIYVKSWVMQKKEILLRFIAYNIYGVVKYYRISSELKNGFVESFC